MNPVLLVLAGVLLASAGSAAADMVAVNPTGETQAELLAVGGTGHATASGRCGVVYYCVKGVAVSGAGNAQGGQAVAPLGSAAASRVPMCTAGYLNICLGGIALSATGPTDGSMGASIAGEGRGGSFLVGANPAYLVPVWLYGPGVSVLGSAASCAVYPELGCIAVSGAGSAAGHWGVSLLGDAASCPFQGWYSVCLAASGTGAARGGFLGASLTGDSSGTVAASGTGHASGAYAVSACDAMGACLDPL